MPEKLSYTIGRRSENDVVIQNNKVSGYHAKVSIVTKDVLLLEDLDSTNGTYINDRQIKRGLVTKRDKVFFGSLRVEMTKMFPANKMYNEHSNLTDKEKFYALKGVYDNYIEFKEKLAKEQKKRGIYMKGGVLVGAATLSMVIPGIGLLGGFAGLILSEYLKPEEKIKAVKMQFEQDYVCPHCNEYLDGVPWEKLRKNKACSFPGCRKKWYEGI